MERGYLDNCVVWKFWLRDICLFSPNCFYSVIYFYQCELVSSHFMLSVIISKFLLFQWFISCGPWELFHIVGCVPLTGPHPLCFENFLTFCTEIGFMLIVFLLVRLCNQTFPWDWPTLSNDSPQPPCLSLSSSSKGETMPVSTQQVFIE